MEVMNNRHNNSADAWGAVHQPKAAFEIRKACVPSKLRVARFGKIGAQIVASVNVVLSIFTRCRSCEHVACRPKHAFQQGERSCGASGL